MTSKRQAFLQGLFLGFGIVASVIVAFGIAIAADILTVDKDGTIRLRVSDQGKVTLNTSTTTEGDLRFATRSSDPSAPLAGDLWYNDTAKLIKYADGGMTKPLAETTNAAITLYVNGSTGNDNNDGLTSGTAVKTIQKAVNLVPPVVRHAVTIDVSPKDGTYVFRDQGATVDGSTVNVYVGDKYVTASGSITFVGNEAAPANVRVTGADVDPTPARSVGFMFYKVQNVSAKGFTCNYFSSYGIKYNYYASGSPQNVVCNNNGIGIAYDWHCIGSPTSCTTSNNTNYGIDYYAHGIGSPSSCTVAGNGNAGIIGFFNSHVSPSNCSISSNGSHGIRYYMGCTGLPGNNTSAANNTGYGIYSTAGSTVDFSGTTPGGTSGPTAADAYSAIY